MLVFVLFSIAMGVFAGNFQTRKKVKLGSTPIALYAQKDSPLPKAILAEAVPTYPWQNKLAGKFSPITKEYFRCKGSPLSPPIPIRQNDAVVENIFDCNGPDTHSLPIRRGKEFIYPILIELLNEIQTALAKPVVITSGHRCPAHNRYVDLSPKNQGSKHQIGAEVSFYVVGAEHDLEAVIRAVTTFYTSNPRYALEGEAYARFERYDKEVDTATKPWLNKEIFLKLHLPHEGRNGDNRHPFPYFSIQVRFDRDTNMRVAYSPAEAQCFFRR